MRSDHNCLFQTIITLLWLHCHSWVDNMFDLAKETRWRQRWKHIHRSVTVFQPDQKDTHLGLGGWGHFCVPPYPWSFCFYSHWIPLFCPWSWSFFVRDSGVYLLVLIILIVLVLLSFLHMHIDHHLGANCCGCTLSFPYFHVIVFAAHSSVKVSVGCRLFSVKFGTSKGRASDSSMGPWHWQHDTTLQLWRK